MQEPVQVKSTNYYVIHYQVKINSKKQKINLIFKNKQAALSMMYTKPVLKTNYVNLIQILSYIKKQINEKN